jgi:hypothetical protein
MGNKVGKREGSRVWGLGSGQNRLDTGWTTEGGGFIKAVMLKEPQAEAEPVKVPWHDTAWFKWVVVAGFGLLIVGKCVLVLVVKNKGQDFAWHLGVGQTVLDGTPYKLADGKVVGDHYLPGRLIIDAGLQLLTLRGAQAFCLALSLVGMLWMARVWGKMADAVRPAGNGVHLAAVALGFLLLAPWVVRDFDEAGLQILLLVMLTLVGWCVYRGKSVAAGAWLALAMTYKSTPVLFLPLLIYKRQWTAAGCAVVFFIMFNVVVPGILWGPEKTREALEISGGRIVALASLKDPCENGIEPPKHQNQSLAFAMARYLQTHPPGHPLFFHEKFDGDFANQKGTPETDPALGRAHWGFVQFLDLDNKTAKRVITGVLGLIALALAWRMRKRWGLLSTARDSGAGGEGQAGAGVLAGGEVVRKTSALAPEWAAACAFASLMSPMNWLHHMTLMLPCAYLVVRDLLLGPAGRKWRLAALGVVVVCVWVLQRDPLPRQFAVLVMSYHEDVLACLILVVMALTVREGAGTEVERERARVAG